MTLVKIYFFIQSVFCLYGWALSMDLRKPPGGEEKERKGTAEPGAPHTKSPPHVRFFTLRRFYWLFYGREHCKSLHPVSAVLTASLRGGPIGRPQRQLCESRSIVTILVFRYGRRVSRNISYYFTDFAK